MTELCFVCVHGVGSSREMRDYFMRCHADVTNIVTCTTTGIRSDDYPKPLTTADVVVAYEEYVARGVRRAGYRGPLFTWSGTEIYDSSDTVPTFHNPAFWAAVLDATFAAHEQHARDSHDMGFK